MVPPKITDQNLGFNMMIFSYKTNLPYACGIFKKFSSFCQHVPVLSGGAVMDNVFHLTNTVMEIKGALMAVMN